MSDCLWPHGLQHSRLPYPSLSPRVCSNSCPLSQWCHPTISSSIVPFSSCLQSFPSSGSFPLRQFFTSSGQSFGASASASVFPMNIQDWFPLVLTGLISCQSKGCSRVFSNTTVKKHQFFRAQHSSPHRLQHARPPCPSPDPGACSNSYVQLSHPYMTTGKTIALTRRTFVGKVISLFAVGAQ